MLDRFCQQKYLVCNLAGLSLEDKAHQTMFVSFLLKSIKKNTSFLFSVLNNRPLKKTLFIAAWFLFFSEVKAQDNSAYFIYKVLTGETFSSIASVYNLSPQALAEYNNLDYYDGEVKSKTLRIPFKIDKVEAKNDEAKKAQSLKTNKEHSEQAGKLLTENMQRDSAGIKSEAIPELRAKAKQAIQEDVNTKDDSEKSAMVIPNQNNPSKPIIFEPQTEQKSETAKEDHSFPPVAELAPVLIFLTASIVLLIASIFFYRALKKN